MNPELQQINYSQAATWAAIMLPVAGIIITAIIKYVKPSGHKVNGNNGISYKEVFDTYMSKETCAANMKGIETRFNDLENGQNRIESKVDTIMNRLIGVN